MPGLVENLLNPALDWDRIRDTFSEHTWAVVDDVLQQPVAEAIFECLSTTVPWEVAFREDGVDKSVPIPELARLSPEKQHQLR